VRHFALKPPAFLACGEFQNRGPKRFDYGY
jgi:hypothetical protein